VAQSPANGPNQCWSADFVSDKLADGRSYRILTIVDQFTRECIALEADRSLHGTHVVAALKCAIEERGTAPRSITVDNGSEFTGRALEAWPIQDGAQLCFIRPGRPVENGFIESRPARIRQTPDRVTGSLRRQMTPPLIRFLAFQKISIIGAKRFLKSLTLEIRY
jgi:putative transposase